MGILARFKDIMSANINSLLDSLEDPSKMIDEYLRQVTENLAEVKDSTAEVMAEETRTKRLLDENEKNIKKYGDLAYKALEKGNEEDSRTFLSKKQEYVNLKEDLEKAYSIAKDNADKMKQMHDKLVKDLEILKQRRTNVKSKVAVAKTQEKINQITSSVTDSSKAMQSFERMEEKADKMLNKANAYSELNLQTDEVEKLENKYSKYSSYVDDELTRMKKEIEEKNIKEQEENQE